MKPSIHKFRNLVPAVVIIFFITSCTSTKYAALPCPDSPQVHKTKEIKVPRNLKIFASKPTRNNNTRLNRRNFKINSNPISSLDQVQEVNNDLVTDLPDYSNPAYIIPSLQTNTQNLPPPSEEYYTNLSDDVEFQSLEIEANFPKTNSLSPYIPKYSASEVKILKSTDNFQDSVPQIEGLGLAGFISGIVGLFIAGIPLGTIAIVFGAVSLSKINKNPQRFSGKGFALTSLIIGIVDVAAMIILLSVLL